MLELGVLCVSALVGRSPHGAEGRLTQLRYTVGKIAMSDDHVVAEASDQAVEQFAADRTGMSGGGIDAKDLCHAGDVTRVICGRN